MTGPFRRWARQRQHRQLRKKIEAIGGYPSSDRPASDLRAPRPGPAPGVRP